jgi:hypothetical protein
MLDDVVWNGRGLGRRMRLWLRTVNRGGNAVSRRLEVYARRRMIDEVGGISRLSGSTAYIFVMCRRHPDFHNAFEGEFGGPPNTTASVPR